MPLGADVVTYGIDRGEVPTTKSRPAFAGAPVPEHRVQDLWRLLRT
jgi:hypothetical protein